jgi:hypothetical protein
MQVPRTRSSPRKVVAAAIGLTTALSLVGGPAQAAPRAVPATAPVGAHTVTLPSGDKLTVRADGAGHLLASPVRPGTPIVTHTLGGDLYAFPLSAMRQPGFDPARYDVSALLRGEQTAPPTVRPHFPMRTVTLNVIDDQGKPADFGFVAVVNVDDSRKYIGFVQAVNGIAKISVPDGNYSAMVDSSVFDANDNLTAVRFAFADFTVSGGPTSASVDARTATHPISVGAPKPGAELLGQDLTWYRGSSDTTGLSDGYIGFPGDVTFYVGDSPASVGVQHFYVHDRFESPAGAAKPYVYDVEFPTDGALTGDQHHEVDPADLTILDTRYHGDVAENGLTLLFGVLPWETFVGRVFYPVAIPQRRTEYATATHGLVYSGTLITTQDAAGEYVTGGNHVYRAGRRTTIDWMQGPIVPGLPADTGIGYYLCQACREDDTLSVFLAPLTDTEPDHAGYLAPPGDGVVSTARFQLFQGDTKLADLNDYTGGDFTVGPDPADYRIVYDQTRITPTSKLSTGTHSEWTFRSQHSGASTVPDRWYCGTTYTQTDCSAVSMLTLGYQLPQSLAGTVRTGPETLTLNVGHSPGSPAVPVKRATVAVSYDRGAHWTPVPVIAAGHGRFVALWTNGHATAGKTVSLRVTAADTAGNTVSQTVTDAAAITAS